MQRPLCHLAAIRTRNGSVLVIVAHDATGAMKDHFCSGFRDLKRFGCLFCRVIENISKQQHRALRRSESLKSKQEGYRDALEHVVASGGRVFFCSFESLCTGNISVTSRYRRGEPRSVITPLTPPAYLIAA